MTYYEAKFKRAEKPRPVDWLIIETSRGVYKLVEVPAWRATKR